MLDYNTALVITKGFTGLFVIFGIVGLIVLYGYIEDTYDDILKTILFCVFAAAALIFSVGMAGYACYCLGNWVLSIV